MANQDWPDERSAKPRMSGGTKFLIFLVAAAGLLGLVCCGGVVFLGYRFTQSISQDPVVVRKATADIADINIPADFKPLMSMDMMVAKVVMYGTPGESILVLTSVTQGGNNAQSDAQMQQAMRNQGGGQRELDIIKSETRELQVKGKPEKFKFAEAKDPETGKEFRQVSGTFPGKSGPASLMLQVPAEKYDEEEVVKMIESIR